MSTPIVNKFEILLMLVCRAKKAPRLGEALRVIRLVAL